MKNIIVVDQARIVSMGLNDHFDLYDFLILDAACGIFASYASDRQVFEGETWWIITPERIAEELPMLTLGVSAIKKRLIELAKYGLLEKSSEGSMSVKKPMFRPTELLDSITSTRPLEDRSSQLHTLTRPLEDTSSQLPIIYDNTLGSINLINIDNILDIDKTKDIENTIYSFFHPKFFKTVSENELSSYLRSAALSDPKWYKHTQEGVIIDPAWSWPVLMMNQLSNSRIDYKRFQVQCKKAIESFSEDEIAASIAWQFHTTQFTKEFIYFNPETVLRTGKKSDNLGRLASFATTDLFMISGKFNPGRIVETSVTEFSNPFSPNDEPRHEKVAKLLEWNQNPPNETFVRGEFGYFLNALRRSPISNPLWDELAIIGERKSPSALLSAIRKSAGMGQRIFEKTNLFEFLKAIV